MVSRTRLFKEPFTELRNITTIDLACKAASVLEKILWIIIFISGTVWAVYFISVQFISFDENASVLIQGNSEEIELKYPAITICPKVSTKYGIAERLANYIDPDLLPEKFLQLKNGFFTCGLGTLSPPELSKKYDDNAWVENDYSSGSSKIRTFSTPRSRSIKICLNCIELIDFFPSFSEENLQAQAFL